MAGQGRLGDKAFNPLDVHGCLACPHPTTGPAISGSPDVNVNRRPAVRVDDNGVHAPCCGTNTWTALTGSDSVFIDGKPAHRIGDKTLHCGGRGTLIEGSSNVIVGGGETNSGRPTTSDDTVSFTLTYDSGEPIADERYSLTTPDGQVKEGRTDASGAAVIAGVKPGKSKLRFSDME